MKGKFRQKKYTNQELINSLTKQGDEIISTISKILSHKKQQKPLQIYTSNSQIVYNEENEVYNKAIEIVGKLNKMMAEKAKISKDLNRYNNNFSKAYKHYKIFSQNPFGKEKEKISYVCNNLIPLYKEKNYIINDKHFSGDIYSEDGLIICDRNELVDYFAKVKYYDPNINKSKKYINFVKKLYNQIQNIITKHKHQNSNEIWKIEENKNEKKNKKSKNKRENLVAFLKRLKEYENEKQKYKEEINRIKELINIAENEYKNFQNESTIINSIDQYNDNACSKSTITKHVTFLENEQKKEIPDIKNSRNLKMEKRKSCGYFSQNFPLLNEEIKKIENISKNYDRKNSACTIIDKSKINSDKSISTKTHYLKSTSNDTTTLPEIKSISSNIDKLILRSFQRRKSNLIKIKKIFPNNLSMDQNISTNRTMKLNVNDEDTTENIEQSQYIIKQNKLRKIYEDLKKCNCFIKNSDFNVEHYDKKNENNKKQKTRDLLVEMYGERKVKDFNENDLRKELQKSFRKVENGIEMLEITNNIYKRFKYIIPQKSKELVSKSKSQNDILKKSHDDYVTCIFNYKIKESMI